MSDSEGQQPKIIVDEDWKAQVQAEKQQAEGRAFSDKKGPPSDVSQATGAAETMRLPPATLSFLVTTLATQAMVLLGEISSPVSGKTEIRRAEAKHFIDTLAMLEEKTAGNRTLDETAILGGVLHQLRLAYIGAPLQPSGESAAPKDGNSG